MTLENQQTGVKIGAIDVPNHKRKKLVVIRDNFATVYGTFNDDVSANSFMVELEKFVGIRLMDPKIEAVRQKVEAEDLFLMLAEEASELAHSALKYARVIGGRNPTPVSMAQAVRSVIEEFSDLKLCADVAGLYCDDGIYNQKLSRWIERLEEQDGNE